MLLLAGSKPLAAQPTPSDSSPPPSTKPSSGGPTAPADSADTVTPETTAAIVAPTEPEARVPFAFGDFTWMNGQSRQKEPAIQLNKSLTLSLYLDAYYALSSHMPKDNTLTGTASVSRSNEFQINLASIGLEWNHKNVIGRISLQWGTMINVIQDLDGTPAKGRTLSSQNLRYIREATLGYHFDAAWGVNVEAGIFMSYIGLESYLLAENWNYNRSLVCEATPFYFQGMRVQYFPTRNLKIEPWLMNGWQTYGKWNNAPSAGMALRWSPSESIGIVGNFYVGTDTKGQPERVRFHHDDSVIARYYNSPTSSGVSKLAFSINNHVGFEEGGKGLPGPSGAHMLGSAIAHRIWLDHDRFAVSVRGELFTNPTLYMAQFPPPSLPTGPGAKLTIVGITGTLEVMPTDFFGVRLEGVYRRANRGFFAGHQGTTSADGFQGGPTEGFTGEGRKEQVLAVLAANFRL